MLTHQHYSLSTDIVTFDEILLIIFWMTLSTCWLCLSLLFGLWLWWWWWWWWWCWWWWWLLSWLQRIKAGEELTLAYTSLWGSEVARRQDLVRNWFFVCRCERCESDDDWGSHLDTVRCQSSDLCQVSLFIPDLLIWVIVYIIAGLDESKQWEYLEVSVLWTGVTLENNS